MEFDLPRNRAPLEICGRARAASPWATSSGSARPQLAPQAMLNRNLSRDPIIGTRAHRWCRAEGVEAMLFRAGGSSPEAAFGTRKAPPSPSDTARGEALRGVRPLLREAQAESIVAGLACALLLIVWGGS